MIYAWYSIKVLVLGGKYCGYCEDISYKDKKKHRY